MVHLHGHGSHGDQIFTRPDIRDLWLSLYRELGHQSSGHLPEAVAWYAAFPERYLASTGHQASG